jgi:hypothetical protein
MQKHTHKIIRLTGGVSYVYKCADPDCTYLIHHAQIYHLVGRKAICWECGDFFVLSEDSLNMDLPACDSCAVPGINELVKDIGKSA